MNIFGLEHKTDVDYFLPYTFAKRKSKGGKYLILAVNKEDKTALVQAFGKRRPLKQEQFLIPLSDLVISFKDNEDKELIKAARRIKREVILDKMVETMESKGYTQCLETAIKTLLNKNWTDNQK